MRKLYFLALLPWLVSACAAVSAADPGVKLECPDENPKCVAKYSILDTITFGAYGMYKWHKANSPQIQKENPAQSPEDERI